MTLGPTPAERLNRARADLRMGVPVVLVDAGQTTLFAAAEGIGNARLAMIRSLGAPILALTDRRAETLKVAAYDGDLVRLHLPPDADTLWVRDMADPSHDLAHPMKGPFRPLRDGSATPARTALLIAKSAHLLPAVLLVDLPGGAAVAQDQGLTLLDLAPDAARTHCLVALRARRRRTGAHGGLTSRPRSRLSSRKRRRGSLCR